MALEHALLVALCEQPAAGLELAKRFERSIGFFWSATHQQIYRTLARMEADGWVDVQTEQQIDRPAKRIYSVTPTGSQTLTDWLAEPSEIEPLRSALTVKMRAGSYGDRASLLANLDALRADHELRLKHFHTLLVRDYPDPESLTDQELDHYLVLAGGIRLEEFWIAFLSDYCTAHRKAVS